MFFLQSTISHHFSIPISFFKYMSIYIYIYWSLRILAKIFLFLWSFRPFSLPIPTMAATASNGFSTRFPVPIAEPSTSYSSTASRSQIRFGSRHLRIKRLVSETRFSSSNLNPSCCSLTSSENSIQSNKVESMALAVSALELLKTSAAESESHFEILIF